ncbi:hypothetical protein GCK32_018070 [Trichostrongylus colubriformis]|uniref:Uncharacterized protein n=1 Tax=Trichostrongylus colubriformis TaxID=6319 RepID=A0AAN8IXK9_TRICO
MYVSILYLPSVLVERAFASKFVTDYEKLPRSWIYMTIIPSGYLMSVFASFSSMLGCFNTTITAALIATFFIVFCIAFVTVFRRNLVKLRAINRGDYKPSTIYTLSTKFQLKENLKMMKILMQLAIMWAVTTVIGCLSFVLTTNILTDSTQWSRVGFQILNVCYAISSNVIVLIFTNALHGMNLQSFWPCATGRGIIPQRQPINEHRGASNAYFDQMNTAWNG